MLIKNKTMKNMKNLSNLISKTEIKTNTETINNNIDEKPIIVVKKIFIQKAKKIWNSIKKERYVYDNDELSKLLFNTIKNSLLEIDITYKNIHLVLTHTKKIYDIEKDKFSESFFYKTFPIKSYGNIENFMKYSDMTEERYKNMVLRLSKNGKKRLNNKIIKLKSSLDNLFRLEKFLNYIETNATNQNVYKIYMPKEKQIAIKREAYKEIIKYIKMDLSAELKKARENYKETKGDFYKKIK